MKRWIALVLVVFVAVIGAGSYFAMEACSVVMTCYAGDPDPDAQIDACTRMIESGFMIGESVAFPLQVWGDAYVRKGLYDLAIADYDEAIRLLPEFPSFFYGRGDAYLRKDLPDRAIADFDEAIRLDPEIAGYYHSRGYAHSVMSAYDRAIADYDEAIRLDPNDAHTFFNRGTAFFTQDLLDRAIADYGEVIRLEPDNHHAFLGRCAAFMHIDSLDRAIADCTEAIRLDPKYVHAFQNRCGAHVLKGLKDRAIADCNEAVRLAPGDPETYFDRGNAYRRLGQLDRAIADYDNAVRLRPDHALALGSQAWLLATAKDARLRDGERAVSLAERALALEDAWGRRSTLAAALAEAGRFEDAVREQQAAIEGLREAGGEGLDDLTLRLDLYRAGKPYRE